ncbi:MAG: hypothetical protein Q8Q12_13925, partial [bacterium]|nr:hypothetical protein [bacterium]
SQEGPQRIYANFVAAQSAENETQLTFCDVDPLSKEQAKVIMEQQEGIHFVPAVARIVLSHKVAKALGEILSKQAKWRESDGSKDA